MVQVRVFLDVDDLESIEALEEYVGQSAAMLVLLGSPRYFGSANCMREVRAAQARGTPLVRVHDSDRTKHGAPLDELREACPAECCGAIFDEEPERIIRWHRVAEFQVKVVAQMAEQLLLASPAYHGESKLPLMLSGGLAWATPFFPRRTGVYISPHNQEADEVLSKLLGRYEQLYRADTLPMACQEGSSVESGRVEPSSRGTSMRRLDRATTMRMLRGLASMRRDPAGDDQAAAPSVYFLLVLGRETWRDGDRSAALAAEVMEALQAGIELVLVYSPQKVTFDEVLRATSAELLAKKVYAKVAIEWYTDGSSLQEVSERIVAKALGAQMGQAWEWAELGRRAGDSMLRMGERCVRAVTSCGVCEPASGAGTEASTKAILTQSGFRVERRDGEPADAEREEDPASAHAAIPAGAARSSGSWWWSWAGWPWRLQGPSTLVAMLRDRRSRQQLDSERKRSAEEVVVVELAEGGYAHGHAREGGRGVSDAEM